MTASEVAVSAGAVLVGDVGVLAGAGAGVVLAAIAMAARQRAAAVRACSVGDAVKSGGKLQRR